MGLVIHVHGLGGSVVDVGSRGGIGLVGHMQIQEEGVVDCMYRMFLVQVCFNDVKTPEEGFSSKT